MNIYNEILDYAKKLLKGNILGYPSTNTHEWKNLTYKFIKIEQRGRKNETCFLFEIIDEEGNNTRQAEVFSLDELSGLEIMSSEQTLPKYTKEIDDID